MRFGKGLMSIFVPIYLYSLGYPIHQIIIFFIFIFLSYIILSYLGAKFVSKVGVNHAILYSVPFTIIYYFGLRFIGTYPELFFVLPVITAIGGLMMNYSYHMNYLHNSNCNIRGEEVSISQIIFTVASALGPFVGGLIISFFGFSNLFLVGVAVLFLAYTPLFFNDCENIKLDFSYKDMWTKFTDEHDWGNFVSFAGYALESTIRRKLWPIFVLTILGTVSKTGFIISLTTVISIVLYALIGELSDRYDKSKLIDIGAIMLAIGWIGRIFVKDFLSILIIDGYGNLSYKILKIPWSAKSYNLADSDYEDTYLFIVIREITYKLSRVLFLPFLAYVFYVDFHPFKVSFIVASIASLCYIFLGKTDKILNNN